MFLDATSVLSVFVFLALFITVPLFIYWMCRFFKRVFAEICEGLFIFLQIFSYKEFSGEKESVANALTLLSEAIKGVEIYVDFDSAATWNDTAYIEAVRAKLEEYADFQAIYFFEREDENHALIEAFKKHPRVHMYVRKYKSRHRKNPYQIIDEDQSILLFLEPDHVGNLPVRRVHMILRFKRFGMWSNNRVQKFVINRARQNIDEFRLVERYN